MRLLLSAPVLSLLFAASALSAQQTRSAPDRGVHFTIFRSPATGIELRNGNVSLHAGFYPTILSRNGDRENVNFIRIGGSYYARQSGSSPYVTPSIVISLDRDWKHGALTEAGYRARLYRGLYARAGVGVLALTNGDVRVNPTVGMDVRIGGAR